MSAPPSAVAVAVAVAIAIAIAIAGVGETAYYKRGQSPVSELVLTFEAVRKAADDAGLNPREIDGFASFSNDDTTPVRLAALGVHDVTFSNMVWGAGGGGCAAAVANACADVSSGMSRHVVVYRGLAQGEAGRFGRGNYPGTGESPYVDFLPYGMFAPAHSIALQSRRFMHVHGVGQDALVAVALTSYRHAQRNPRAIMYGRPLTREQYDASRWIAEPFHLFDCCQENDGAAAVIVTSAERAQDLRMPLVTVLDAQQGTTSRQHARDRSGADFGSANFPSTAPRLWAQSGLSPADVDVVQAYENFTGGVAALVEHGFCAPDGVNEFMTESGSRSIGARCRSTQAGQPRRGLHPRPRARRGGGASAARRVH